MPASPDLTEKIAALIAAEGPIPLDRFMALANDHYYATRDPFGADGDFVTAPEISQMFGELIGLCLADLWHRAGAPRCAYVELGPGRGTLAADALRAMRVAGLDPPVHLIETSPLLRARQHERLPGAVWHDSVATLPTNMALLIVANEFFDALPVRQFLRTAAGWRERMVAIRDGGLVLHTADLDAEETVPQHLRDAEAGSVVERRPAASAVVEALAARMAGQGGALLAIDYGHDGRAPGDTLQAIRDHAFADPLASPGTRDLTAHVDFGALAVAASAAAGTFGPVDQGQWLIALGLSDRAAALARQAPDRTDEIAAAYRRLTHADAMGRLFKAMAVVARGWPTPAGFA